MLTYLYLILCSRLKTRSKSHFGLKCSGSVVLKPSAVEQNSLLLEKLNEDCLEAVFKFLNLNDLCNAAEVCIRFNQHAIYIFHLKYRDLFHNEFHLLDKQAVEYLFKNFAPLINTIEANASNIERNFEQNDFLLKIQKRCLNLRELILNEFSDFTSEHHILFGNLERFTLSNSFITYKTCEILNKCKKLRKLELRSCMWGGTRINEKFPMLQEANFCNMQDDIFKGGMSSFIALHPTITVLIIGTTFNSGSRLYKLSTELLSTIGQNLPNLMHLQINARFLGDFQRHIVYLGRLQSLQTLGINFDNYSIAPLITSLATNQIPIQTLLLYNGVVIDGDEAVEYLSQLKQIKTLILSLIDNLATEHLVNLSKSLPELDRLHLHKGSNDFGSIALKKVVENAKKLSYLRLESMKDFEIDEEDYKVMLKSVQSRPEIMKLRITVKSDENQVHVPEETMNANRESFYINVQVST